MNDTTYDTSFMKHIVSHILYGLSLFLVIFAFYVTMKGPFVSSSGLYFIKKNRCIGNPMICQFTLWHVTCFGLEDMNWKT